MNKYLIIKLSLEYFCFPLWVKEHANDIFTNINHNEVLELNEELKNLLNQYQKTYQSTYNSEYPPHSKFKNLSEEEGFNSLSINIANKLKSIFPNTIVLRCDIFKFDFEEIYLNR